MKIRAAAAVGALSLALSLPFAGRATARGEALPAPAPGPAPAPEEPPRVEVAFALDTTGSMGGLIDAARRKIWAIANELARAKPTPEIRLGLVAYRDRGDAYVTRIHDLDADLDRVYARLCGFRAEGGGDGPESVNEGLRAAVTGLSWTKGDRVLRVVFLVGDAPPHMDYDRDVPFARTCEEAARAGILVNTLRCGGDPATGRVWAEIARLAEGVYASLPQEGGAETVPTPFDGRLAELGSSLGRTLVAYGDGKGRRDAAKRLEAGEGLARAAAPPGAGDSVAADRAEILAKSGGLGEADLVAAVAGGRVRLEDVPAEALPEEMRAMTSGERRAFLAKRTAERDALRREMADLEAKRAAFLEEARRGAAGGGKGAFDVEVAKTLRAQAARKGFTFGE